MRYFTYMDEIYSQSHFFFTKEDLTKLGFKKKKIFSLTSDKKENIYKVLESNKDNFKKCHKYI